MKQQHLVSILLCVVLSIAAYVQAAEPQRAKREPVVLTLRATETILRMDLGLLEGINIVSQADTYALEIILTADGAARYQRFMDKTNGAPVTLQICRDDASSLGLALETKQNTFFITGLQNRLRAERLADQLWYGDGCGGAEKTRIDT
jgi:hypothetical protein